MKANIQLTLTQQHLRDLLEGKTVTEAESGVTIRLQHCHCPDCQNARERLQERRRRIAHKPVGTLTDPARARGSR